MEWELLLGVLLAIPVVLYLLGRRAHSYWRNRSVFQLEPTFFFGDVLEIVLSKRTLVNKIDQIYTQHKEKRFIGLYSFYKKILVVTDPDLAKDVLTKDFQSFFGSGLEMEEKVDPLITVNPFGTMDFDIWKERRGLHVSQYTPSKLKTLPGQLQRILQSMLKYISGFSSRPINVKELAELFTIDSAVSTFYGVEPGALEDPDNIFRKQAKDTVFSHQIDNTFLSALIFPIVGKLLKWRFFSYECQEFFTTLTSQLIAQREKETTPRGDIVDAIIKTDKKLQSEGKEGLRADERTAHIVAAYLDPVFSTGSTLRSLMLDLASNPGVQKRAQEEILTAGVCPEEFDSIEKINSLKYLHMIVNESLRMHPILPLMSRLCSKKTVLAGAPIEPGTKIIIPICSYHKDQDFFPDPEEYRPERFEDWKDGEGPFFPFGDGPRMCVGFRYAQTVMKMAIICILQKYTIKPVKQSDVKEFFSKDYLFAEPNIDASLLFVPL